MQRPTYACAGDGVGGGGGGRGGVGGSEWRAEDGRGGRERAGSRGGWGTAARVNYLC